MNESVIVEQMCRLCKKNPAIENSHVIPAFVFRAIKSDSPTGFFRNANAPNRRLQDGDKEPLLCAQCESVFAAAEGEFAKLVFSPFHNQDKDHFTYGPWLHYFMTSLAWRTLILDLPGLESNPNIPRSMVDHLSRARNTMERYLLGASRLGAQLHNHAFVFTAVHACSEELASLGPNVMMRRSVFGYTVVADKGYAAVMHNLGGFLCFLIIKGNPRDSWQNTKVDPISGILEQPQKVNSWLWAEMIDCLAEAAKTKENLQSQVQRRKTLDAMKKNPTAKSLRFRDWDDKINIE